MHIQTSSKESATMTVYDYWKIIHPRNSICRLINAYRDLGAIQARDGFVNDVLDCNL